MIFPLFDIFCVLVVRGNYNLNLDSKGRLSIPTRQRESLLNHSDGHLVVTVSPQDRCLWLYTLSAWEEVEVKFVNLPTLNQVTRDIKDILLGHACDCEMDGSGRILIPAHLRTHIGLDKKAVLVGIGDKFAIWDEGLWTARREALLAMQIDENSLPEDVRNLAF